MKEGEFVSIEKAITITREGDRIWVSVEDWQRLADWMQEQRDEIRRLRGDDTLRRLEALVAKLTVYIAGEPGQPVPSRESGKGGSGVG